MLNGHQFRPVQLLFLIRQFSRNIQNHSETWKILGSGCVASSHLVRPHLEINLLCCLFNWGSRRSVGPLTPYITLDDHDTCRRKKVETPPSKQQEGNTTTTTNNLFFFFHLAKFIRRFAGGRAQKSQTGQTWKRGTVPPQSRDSCCASEFPQGSSHSLKLWLYWGQPTRSGRPRPRGPQRGVAGGLR